MTPGSSPLTASSLKQSLQSPKYRMTALERPQRWQRLIFLVENLGFLSALTSSAVLDIGLMVDHGSWIVDLKCCLFFS